MKTILRYYTATAISHLMIASGLAFRAKKKALKGDYILSVFFHSPEKSQFEFCIKWLKKNGFSFLSTADIVSIRENKMPFPKGAVVLTVDDGWATNEHNIVEVANKYNVPVTIFVSTEPTQKGVFWWSYVPVARKQKVIQLSKQSIKDQPNSVKKSIVREMENCITLPREAMTTMQVKQISGSDFVTIGSHTVTHPILIRCTDDEAFEEIAESKIQLERITEKPVLTFAYPNGNFSTREIEILKHVGYSAAFCSKPIYLTRKEVDNIYELPRFCVFEKSSRAETICRMLGVWQTSLQTMKYLFKLN